MRTIASWPFGPSARLRRDLSSAFFFAVIAFVSSSARADEPSCAVERFVGISEDDARAVEEIVCPEVAEHATYGRRHRIRIAKLGSKVVLTLVSDRPDGGPRIEKQLVLSGLEEVPVAAPRLVQAIEEQKPVAETQTVSNIVGQETRAPKKKASEIHGNLGIVAAATPGGGSGGGAHMGLSAGSDRWSFVGDLRLAGGAFYDPAAAAITIFSLDILEPKPKADFSYASLSGGVRHHLSATDTSAFLGAGIGLDYLGDGSHDGFGKASNAGIAGYGEIGLDLLRTHVIGGTIALRFDAPAFTLQRSTDGYDPNGYDPNGYGDPGYGTYPQPARVERRTSWAPIVGASFSLRF